MAHVPAAVRRTQIIEAATEVIARDGVAGATTRRIAAEAGLSLATLHYVFNTKDDILAAVLESLIDQAHQDNEKIVAHLAATPPDASPDALPETFHRLLRTAWELMRGEGTIQRAQYELMLYALRTPEAAHLGRTLRDFHLTATEQIMRQAVEHTGHAVDYPLRDLAHLVTCAMDGILLDYLVNSDSEQTDRSLASLTEAALRLSM